MKINESQLRKIIQESVKNILKENTNDLPYLSDDDIHKQYEGFKITEFSIKPRYIFGEYRWDISFGIIFPNAEHSDFDESLWENVCVYDEKGEKMAFENWYPDDITKQLIDFVRSEIQKHWPEMENLKKDQLNKEEETARSIRELMRKYNVDKNPNLNESQLRNIIKESVQKILKESAYDINSPKYKQMYDSGNRWYDGRDVEDDNTSKEIEDYEALPDKIRHPYGTEIPDFSDRRKNNYTNYDNLAEKEPNSILKKQQEKRYFQEDLEQAKQFNPFFNIWCRNNGISREERENLTDDELVNLYRQYLDDKEERRRHR